MARRWWVLMAAALLGPVLYAQSTGRRISYAVDPATAVPAATVIHNGEGITVVIFRVAELDEGGTFVFRADMTARGRSVTFPFDAEMDDRARGNALVEGFDPEVVTFVDGATPASSLVTVTLPPGTYGPKKKFVTKVKAEPLRGSRVGQGTGIKVVILEGTTSSADPEGALLDDILEALSPEP
ncbi:MAG: hypothetical protein AB1347_07125 [Acidobacteriota bacterium]